MKKAIITLSALGLLACSQEKPTKEVIVLKYPQTKKVNQVDDYFGTKVSDPYRWLEDDNSAETKVWVDEENKVTFSYLDKIPFRENVKKRLTQLWNYEKLTAPVKKAGMYFSFYNNGLQNQAVLCVQKNLKDARVELLDPNKLSADGTVSFSGWDVSKDGKYLAYGISKAGSDWVEIHVMEIANKKELSDKIEWVKFSGISWCKNGFYYSRYDAPESGKALTKQNTGHKVYYHEVGTAQSADKLIFADAAHPDRNFTAGVTDDEKYLVLSGSESTSGNSLWIKEVNDATNKWYKLVDNFENDYNVVHNSGDIFYVQTNYKASNQRLVKINLTNTEEKYWQEIIPQQKDLLEGVQYADRKFVASFMHDVASRMNVYDTNGLLLNEANLGGLCKVNDLSTSDKDTIAFFTRATFTAPPAVYTYNVKENRMGLFFQPKTDFKSEDYETKQVFFTSKDGTKIPMFITAKKGVELNGNNPCFVFGYGGFNAYYSPEYRTDRALFLEAGGIYCVPGIRGGGDYGEDWHKAGVKCKKQNVFDDFIAACDYLVAEKYTSHEKLAIHGRSNGGLLIGAVMTERPDIAKVCIPTVGVLDMLRFHLFTIGRAWTVDYGCSENKEEFACLYKYSPLHNVKKTNYPATLVLTGDHDDRVVPAHSFKFAATLQENQTGSEPIIIRIDKNAGHGAGKPTAKQIDEYGDMWSFVFYNLGVDKLPW
ncbi:MAG TPA: prolyl oligopeptidase family serine peptidase [Bacteroidia bacterium]|nr:prolyl oligopeptidase family serine peptidase [Bacteroidia bacterium]